MIAEVVFLTQGLLIFYQPPKISERDKVSHNVGLFFRLGTGKFVMMKNSLNVSYIM